MDFQLAPDEAAAAATARAFARDVLSSRAASRDRDEVFPEAELRALGELGLLGVTVPEAMGGAGMTPLALAASIAELAEADASVAVTVAVTNMVAEILAAHGKPALSARVLPDLCAGRLGPGAFALSEAQAGSDPAALRTVFRPQPDGGYCLTGTKLWTTSGDRAGILIVVARPEAKEAGAGQSARGLTAFAVERRNVEAGMAGLGVGRCERKMGQRGSTTVALTLDGIRVGSDALVGQENQGFKIALAALDGGRINVAALAIGIARAAFGAARSYARQRQQFRRPIADFQAIRFMLADAATGLDAAWLMTARAAYCKGRGEPITRLCAEAKLLATETAIRICDAALQIHGGYGFTRDFPVERYYRDVRVTAIYEGTSQIQKLVIARKLLQEMSENVGGT